MSNTGLAVAAVEVTAQGSAAMLVIRWQVGGPRAERLALAFMHRLAARVLEESGPDALGYPPEIAVTANRAAPAFATVVGSLVIWIAARSEDREAGLEAARKLLVSLSESV